MRFRIHQPSWIGGAYIEEGMIAPKTDGTKPHSGFDIEVTPLALKGQEITHRVVGKRPKKVRLDEDLWPIPGPHWEPLDADAKALCAKHNHEFTGEMPDVLTGLEEQLAEAQAARLHPDSGATLAEGIVNALIAAGVVQKPAQVAQPRK